MIRHPWKKDGDTRDLAEKRHQAKQEQEQREDDGKDYYEKCNHEHTTKSKGLKICVTCGLCLKQYFSQEMNYDLDRFFLENTGPDHVLEIREKMRELMGVIIDKLLVLMVKNSTGRASRSRTTSRALGLLRRAL